MRCKNGRKGRLRMKILTRKKQNEIIKRLCDNGIIFQEEHRNYECFIKYTDNALKIAELISGCGGVIKYCTTMQKWIESKEDENDRGAI